MLEDFLGDQETIDLFRKLPEIFLMKKISMTYDLNMMNPLVRAFTRMRNKVLVTSAEVVIDYLLQQNRC